MKPIAPPQALFYPFHLCHERTLAALLCRFGTVHFHDFMALQLTPMVGMTAYADRMGDSFPELVAAGRILQGYDVSGPLSHEMAAAIDRDLQDSVWRRLFGSALRTNRRFQHGLFHTEQQIPHASAQWDRTLFTVAQLRRRWTQSAMNDSELEYGLALVKTAASLVYTYRLALTHGLQVATDSPAHFQLFEQTRVREQISLPNHLIIRNGY